MTTTIWLFIHSFAWNGAQVTVTVTGMDGKAHTCFTVFPFSFFPSKYYFFFVISCFLFMWMDALLLFNSAAVIIVDVELLQFPLLSNVNVKNFTRKKVNIQKRKRNGMERNDGWWWLYWQLLCFYMLNAIIFFSIWIEGGEKLISEWLIRGNSYLTDWFHKKGIFFFSSFYRIHSKKSPLNLDHLSQYSKALRHSWIIKSEIRREKRVFHLFCPNFWALWTTDRTSNKFIE